MNTPVVKILEYGGRYLGKYPYGGFSITVSAGDQLLEVIGSPEYGPTNSDTVLKRARCISIAKRKARMIAKALHLEVREDFFK